MGAADDISAAVPADELDAPDPEYLGYLPSTSSDIHPFDNPGIISYNGTTLFDDLDDTGLYSEYMHSASSFGLVTQEYFTWYNFDFSSDSAWFPVNTDADLHLSFRKNFNNGVLMHSVRITTKAADGSDASMVLWFPDASIDDYQGIFMTNEYGQPFDNTGSYAYPNYNVYISSNGTYFPTGTTLPAYFSDGAQVYYNYTIPASQVKSMYDSGSVIYFYMIPTYSGQYSILEYGTDNIINTFNSYHRIFNNYELRIINSSPYVTINYKLFDGHFAYNNLLPTAQRYGFSWELNQGPIISFSSMELDESISKSGSLPKYYLDDTSNIKVYLASETDYIDYINSDQKVVDDNNKAREEYDKKSEEYQDALKGFESLNKPTIKADDVVLPSGSIESIDHLSGILSIIWEDKMIKEMLIISLTFVFVGYILFGKR